MRTLLDVLLYLGVMTAYLSGVYFVARYRRARAVGPAYRAERDWAVLLATAAVPGLLALVIYVVGLI